jgi:hypothetical protein
MAEISHHPLNSFGEYVLLIYKSSKSFFLTSHNVRQSELDFFTTPWVEEREAKKKRRRFRAPAFLVLLPEFIDLFLDSLWLALAARSAAWLGARIREVNLPRPGVGLQLS